MAIINTTKAKSLEKAFSTEVTTTMDAILGMDIRSEWHLHLKRFNQIENGGVIDIVMVVPCTANARIEQEQRDTVLVVEVGFFTVNGRESVLNAGKRAFLEKMDQGQKHLSSMLSKDAAVASDDKAKEGILKMEKPVLLAVAVSDSGAPGNMFCFLLYSAARIRKRLVQVQATTFRMSLMYNVKTKSAEETDNLFSFLPTQIEQFQTLRENSTPECTEWICFGPNCALT